MQFQLQPTWYTMIHDLRGKSLMIDKFLRGFSSFIFRSTTVRLGSRFSEDLSGINTEGKIAVQLWNKQEQICSNLCLFLMFSWWFKGRQTHLLSQVRAVTDQLIFWRWQLMDYVPHRLKGNFNHSRPSVISANRRSTVIGGWTRKKCTKSILSNLLTYQKRSDHHVGDSSEERTFQDGQITLHMMPSKVLNSFDWLSAALFRCYSHHARDEELSARGQIWSVAWQMLYTEL